MKRIIFSFILIAIFFVAVKPVEASYEAGTSGAIRLNIEKQDDRVSKLKAYLETHNSPLSEFAEVFITKADKYQIFDWRLVPAISGVESTFGKAIPFNSYNAYGWANGAYNFKSWEDSIEIVTKTLKTKYQDRGLDTVDKIAPVYAPPSTTWAGKVKFFIAQIENYHPLKSRELAITI